MTRFVTAAVQQDLFDGSDFNDPYPEIMSMAPGLDEATATDDQAWAVMHPSEAGDELVDPAMSAPIDVGSAS